MDEGYDIGPGSGGVFQEHAITDVFARHASLRRNKKN